MSETIIESGGEQVSEDDLRRMLDSQRETIKELERERDTERSTRVHTEAERDRERASRVVTERSLVGEQEQRYNAQRESVKNGITALEAAVDTAEKDYISHSEMGDWKEAAKAQRQMAESAAKLTNLRAQDEFLENNKEKIIQPPAPVRHETRDQPSDRISQYVTDVQPSERVWLEKRPKFLEDPSYRGKVFGASQFASNSGFTRGSDAYFKEMERLLGEGEQEQSRRQERDDDTRDDRRDDTRRERSPSADLAPQRRASPGQQPSGGREIRLTADQAEVADNLYGNPNGVDYIAEPAERYKRYWENLEKRKQQGRM